MPEMKRLKGLSVYHITYSMITLMLCLISINAESDFFINSVDGDVNVIITSDGDLISSVDVTDSSDNEFTADTGFYIKYDDEIKLFIKKDTFHIASKFYEDSICHDADTSFDFIDPTVQSCPQAMLTTNGDFYINGIVLTKDSIGRQPTFVQTEISQNFNDQSPITTTTFFDGLGREIQAQLSTWSNSTKSLTSGTYYDAIGRPFKQTKLANLETKFGSFIPMHDTALIDLANAFYVKKGIDTSNYAYRGMKYFEDPLTRTHAIGMPGKIYSLDTSFHSMVWHFGVPKMPSNISTLDAMFDTTTEFLYATKLHKDTLNKNLPDTLKKYEDSLEVVYYLTIVKDPNGNYTQKLIDILGNVLRTWAYSSTDYTEHDPGKVIMAEYFYDIEGNVMEEVPPKVDSSDANTDIKNTKYLYNARGQVYSKNTPDAGNETYEYDKAGQLKKVIKPDNDVIIFNYDFLNRVHEIWDSVYQVKSYLKIKKFYDDTVGIRNFLSGIDSLNAVLRELTNLIGKPVADVSIYYDSTDSLIKHVVDLYSYNNKGNISAKYKYIPGVHWQKIVLEHDFVGNVKLKTVYPEYLSDKNIDTVALAFEYDDLNRLSFIKDVKQSRDIIKYEYSEIGQIKKKIFKNSKTGDEVATVDIDYTIRDWIKQIECKRGTVTEFKENLGYDSLYNGNIASAVYRYNVDSLDSLIDLTYAYDGVNRLTKVTAAAPQYSVYSEAFKYDNIGRILQTNRKSDTLDENNKYFYFDSTNRLKHVSTKHSTEENYLYDTSGNMTVDSSKDMAVSYDWRDMPIQFRLRTDTLTWAIIDIVYDASGNRVLKTEHYEYLGDTITKAVAYVDDELVYEYNSSDTLDFKLANANLPNNEGRIDFSNGTISTKYLFVQDHLGTTRSVLADNGQPVRADMYFAYGAKDPLYNKKGIRKEFTGKEFDENGEVLDVDGVTVLHPGMGLYYFGFRYYDPEIIMWTSPDPMDEFWNSYSYVGMNPINLIDFLGLSALEDLAKEMIDFLNKHFGGGSGPDKNDLPKWDPKSSNYQKQQEKEQQKQTEAIDKEIEKAEEIIDNTISKIDKELEMQKNLQITIGIDKIQVDNTDPYTREQSIQNPKDVARIALAKFQSKTGRKFKRGEKAVAYEIALHAGAFVLEVGGKRGMASSKVADIGDINDNNAPIFDAIGGMMDIFE